MLRQMLTLFHISCRHDVAEVAGLTSFSFGEEEESRYVMIFKKVRKLCFSSIFGVIMFGGKCDRFPRCALAGVRSVRRGAGSLSQWRGVGSQAGRATAKTESKTGSTPMFQVASH